MAFSSGHSAKGERRDGGEHQNCGDRVVCGGFRVAMVAAAILDVASAAVSSLIIEGKGSVPRTEQCPAPA